MAGCNGVDSLQVNVLPEFTISGKLEVCEGDIVQYFANDAGANWSVSPTGPVIAGNGSNNINVTWTTGSYVLSAVPANPSLFCNDSAFINVEVIAKPILNNIIGPDSICPGKNFTYSISSNTIGSPFVWDITGGTGNIQSEMGADKDSVIVKWTGAGPWQLSVYQTILLPSGDTCQSLVQMLNVFPYPPPSISGLNAVCVDAEEFYTAGGPGDFQWSISPPSQGTIQSGQGTNMVQILWHGPPNSAILTASNCAGNDQMTITILNPPAKPTITPSGPVEYCLPDMPNNLSLSVPGGYTSYVWLLNGVPTGGTSNTYLIPNGSFTGAGAYIFTVEVSNGICTISSSILILIGDCGGGGGSPPNPIVCDIDFTMNPDPACVNQAVTFTAVPTIAGFQYAWDFGDGFTSFKTPTKHIYTSTGTFSVKLTATLDNICVADTTKMITVNPLPSCTLMPDDTIYCPGDSVQITACGTMSAYQWYKNGNAIPGANSMSYFVKTHGEYWVEVDNSFGCSNNSDSVYIYEHSLPAAKIAGDRSLCADTSSVVSLFFSTVYDINYTYNWSSIPAGATFSPSTSYYTYANLTLPATLPAIYQFVVDVTDTITGCRNSDTICVTFYEKPSFSLPYINICEGTPTTLAPTPIDQTQFSYKWNNGANTPIITVSTPGFYSLTVTDLNNGCSTTVDAGFINPKPDLSLFPLGCDDICLADTFDLYIPLPSNNLA
ncbi:MAG: PKD domain-containing protein [Bacteroidales bacterium]